MWRARMATLPSPNAPLVVEVGGEVVGFAVGQLTPVTGAELTAIHVLPEHRGTGAGKALLDAVVAAFGLWGVSDARLHVIAGNERAQAFYRRNGWHLRGLGRHPRDRRRDGARPRVRPGRRRLSDVNHWLTLDAPST